MPWETDHFISRSHFGYYFVRKHDRSVVVFHSRSAKPLFATDKEHSVDAIAPGILAINKEDTKNYKFVDDGNTQIFGDIDTTYVLRSLAKSSPFFGTDEDGERKRVLRDLTGKPIGEYKEVVNHCCGLAYAEPLE